MSEYTPPTDWVRDAFADENYPALSVDEAYAAFDRWLRKVKSEAWNEGYADGRFNADPGLINPYL